MRSHEAIVKYDSLVSGPGKCRAEFHIQFDEETGILFFQSPQSDDIHIFLTLWKLEKEHQLTGMTHYAQVRSYIY